eukprot:XP_014617202.1 protein DETOXIFICATION 16 [Glycine max]
MKRPLPPSVSSDNVEDRKMKKKVKALDTTTMWSAWRASMFDDNLLFEVLKHIDTSDVGMHKQAVTQGDDGFFGWVVGVLETREVIDGGAYGVELVEELVGDWWGGLGGWRVEESLEASTFEIIVLLTGALPNSKLQTSVLSICLNTTGVFWMVPFGVSVAGSIRISNELGDGSAKAAYLAVKVTMFLGSAVGILEFAVLMLVRKVWGRAFTNIHEVATYVTAIIPIVASSAFIDSIQTAFQGVARGCDRQKLGALINLGSYYLLGVPFAIVTACVLHTKGQANKAATRLGGSIVQVEALQGNQNVNTTA